jgi:hypothetical protein
MNVMDTSYTRWIHHGEDLNVDITEHFATNVHDSGDGSTDGIGVTEDDNYDADPWEAVLGDLRTGAEEERFENMTMVVQDLMSKRHFSKKP